MNIEFEVSHYLKDHYPFAQIHENYEIFLSLSERGNLFVRETSYPLKFGTAFILKPFEIHRCFCHGEGDFPRYVLKFSRDALKELSTENTDLVGVFDNSPLILTIPDDEMVNIIDTLRKFGETTDTDFGSDLQRNLHLAGSILDFARIIRSQSKKSAVQSTLEGSQDRRIDMILKYIHEHYNENISLNRISSDVFLSKSRLCKIFKDGTGFSIGDYIIVYRIRNACILLRQGVGVKEAGEQVGFRNNTNFIRSFTRHTGMSPGKYARSNIAEWKESGKRQK